MQIPEKFERFLVDNVKQVIVQNVKSNNSNEPVSFICLQPTLTCQRHTHVLSITHTCTANDTHLYCQRHTPVLSTNGLFSRTTWVSRYQKGKTSLDFTEARDDGVWGWQWHQLDHMQTICTSLQTDNDTSTSQSIFTGRMLFLPPNKQCQSTEGNK